MDIMGSCSGTSLEGGQAVSAGEAQSFHRPSGCQAARSQADQASAGALQANECPAVGGSARACYVGLISDFDRFALQFACTFACIELVVFVCSSLL